MDAEMRKLEQDAALGDEDAEHRLLAARRRCGGGRHADKIGEWVMIDGVRDHYRGRLLSVVELGAGAAILRLAPCYWLGSLESTAGEVTTTATEEHPLDLSSWVVGAVSLQPADWPRT